ncbi:MAG: hypothetical protein IJR55_01995 [Clostridia bacterium]|nr:hypothetical protein [Clostridia bacterium]
MKKENISEIIGNIDEKYIEEAAMYEAPDKKIIDRRGRMRAGRARTHKTKWAIAVACAVLAISVSLGGVAYAAEAKEYNDAVMFFEQNGLAVDGLSRAELKAVYRDISTERFALDKTAEVILNSIPGWEIYQETPTPSYIADLWKRNTAIDTISKEGVSYSKNSVYTRDEQLGFDTFDKCVLDCYRDGNRLWTAEFTDFAVDQCVYTQNGTAVYGFNARWPLEQKSYGWIARVDNSGEILWEKRLDHDGIKNEYVKAIIDNGDGTWTVISRGEKYMFFDKFDINGNEISGKVIEIGYCGIGKAIKLGDGYLVQLGNIFGRTSDTASVIKLDRDGNIIDNFKYNGDGNDYYITDMAEFGGQIYLSTYAVPTQKDAGGRDEIGNVLRYISESGGFESLDEVISNDELTQKVKDNYTAVLLICDADGGAPKTFYSAKGSLGGKLFINDAGRLEWQVESIVSTFFSPFTNSFTIGGTCKVYQYEFNSSGTLINQTDTGDFSVYRR